MVRRPLVFAWLVAALGCQSSPTNPSVDAGVDTFVPTPITLAITSHSDGARMLGSRAITLSGTWSGDASTIVVTHGGTQTNAAMTPGAWTATFDLTDGANVIGVAAYGLAGTQSTNLTLVYPFLSFPDGDAADVVIGQASFTSTMTNQGGAVDGTTLYSPVGDPLAVGGALFVPDTYNQRVLAFAGIPTQNEPTASFAIGQAFLTSVAAGTGANKVALPRGLAHDGTRLYLADSNNARVQIFASIPTASDASAAVTLGTTGAPSCTASTMNAPTAVAAGGGHLLVADSLNNRVLVWTTAPTVSATAPDIILGQTSPTVCTLGSTSGKLYQPTGVWTDGTRVLVADSMNHRVLVWDSFPTASGQSADHALGQPNTMTGTAPASVSATSLNQPTSVVSNGNQIFVAVNGTARVMIWDAFPTADGVAANRVLGATGLGVGSSSAVNASTLGAPSGLLVLDDELVVADSTRSRVLVYTRP